MVSIPDGSDLKNIRSQSSGEKCLEVQNVCFQEYVAE